MGGKASDIMRLSGGVQSIARRDGRLDGQDASEVYSAVFEDDPELATLRRIAPHQVIQLRDAALAWFETDRI
jgi:hypothetical protein